MPKKQAAANAFTLTTDEEELSFKQVLERGMLDTVGLGADLAHSEELECLGGQLQEIFRESTDPLEHFNNYKKIDSIILKFITNSHVLRGQLTQSEEKVKRLEESLLKQEDLNSHV
mmetsp:Transcript_18757/g.28818  ORF Transcript_18757/g.28818 Transcript_18757/m.28818 type:complete len:116 (-) Transcript_18757:2658-3005(-)